MRGFPGAGGTGAPFRGTCPPCSRLDQNVEDMCVKSTGGLLERPAGDGSLAVGGRLFFQGGLVSIKGRALASLVVVSFAALLPSSARVLCSTTRKGCMG